MNKRSQLLLDKLEMQQVLAAYARGVDRADLDLIKSVYWEEAVDHHGLYTLGGQAYAEDLVVRLPRLWSATFHLLGQTYFIEMADERALTETYFIARHASIDPEADGFSICGRYIDEFEKRADQWKILTRYLAFDLMEPAGSRQSFMAGMVVGQRAPHDRSYTLCPDPPAPGAISAKGSRPQTKSAEVRS